MATACLTGLPALTSALMFLRNASGDLDLTSGMLSRSMENSVVQVNGFTIRIVGGIFDDNRERTIGNRRNKNIVRTHCAARAGANYHHIFGADGSASHYKNRLCAGRKLRVSRDDLTRWRVDRHGCGFVVGLRDRIVSTSRISNRACGGDVGRLNAISPNNVLVFVCHTNWFGICHDYFFLAVFAESLNALAVGAPFSPGLRIFSLEPAAMRSRLAWMLA